MSNLQIFNFKSNPVRVELFENQPHFCLLDVCDVFEIQNSRRVQSEMLDPQGVRQAYILAKDKKQRKTSFINEPNLYRIIFRSEKPIAKEFQYWVFEEVLPQLRKTGKYALQNSQPSLPLAPPERKYGFELTQYEISRLVWLHFSHKQMNTLLGQLEKPLETIGSRFHPTVYSHHVEYKRLHEETVGVLKQILEPLKHSHKEEWERLLARLN